MCDTVLLRSWDALRTTLRGACFLLLSILARGLSWRLRALGHLIHSPLASGRGLIGGGCTQYKCIADVSAVYIGDVLRRNCIGAVSDMYHECIGSRNLDTCIGGVLEMY